MALDVNVKFDFTKFMTEYIKLILTVLLSFKIGSETLCMLNQGTPIACTLDKCSMLCIWSIPWRIGTPLNSIFLLISGF